MSSKNDVTAIPHLVEGEREIPFVLQTYAKFLQEGQKFF
jgi:hypothetical protein